MKTAVWTIVTALVLWTSGTDAWVQDAMAVTIGTNTITSGGTNTGTSSFTSITGTPTNTNTSTRSNTATPNVTQLENQNDTNRTNDQGANSSTALGLAAIAAGMAMVAAGMALMANPPTAAAGAALVAAGMALIAAGMAALAAAANMNKNANKAAGNAGRLGTDFGTSTPTATNTSSSVGTTTLVNPGTLPEAGPGSVIKIDPALARNGGKIDSILGDFEQKTGLSRDDLVNGLNSGKNPLEILSNSPKVGKSQDDLQRMMDKSLANNPALSAQDVMSKLGMTPEDLGAGEGAYSAGGGDRKPGSGGGGAPDLDSLFGKNNLDSAASAAAAGAAGAAGALSPEVQAALDRNGITSRSIFEMVHSQYRKKMPVMFGVKSTQLESGRMNAKPLYDLKGTGALEF